MTAMRAAALSGRADDGWWGNPMRGLVALAGAAILVALAGCSSDDSGGPVPPAPKSSAPKSSAPASARKPTSEKSASEGRETSETGELKTAEPAAAGEKRPRAKPRTTNACRVKSPRMISFSKTYDPDELVTIAAVGDVLLHDSVQKRSAAEAAGFYGLFSGVADLIGSADIAFANLEGPVAAGVAKNGKSVKEPKRRYDGRVYSGYPMFNYHPSVTNDLRLAGFDVLLTANNHSMDRYALGADRTVAAVKAAGLAYTGTRVQADKKSPWYAVTPVAKGGKTYKIAWLGCSYSTNGIPDRKGQVLMCYKQRAEVLSTIRRLAARPDIAAVILAPHWGAEYRHRPGRRQVALAKEALNAGAAAVIGTHPHVVQPIERFVTADGRETFIAYSLGNFVSNQIGLPRRASAILVLGLTPDTGARAGKLDMAAVGWIPIWMRKDATAMRAEAIDRPGVKAPPAYKRHLLRHLPSGNLIPPTTPYFEKWSCRGDSS